MTTADEIWGGMSSPIREWARTQGMQVGDRGLIPRTIIDAYKQAHGIGDHARTPIAVDPGRFPPMPAKPRVQYGGDCWILDNGQVAILYDSWPEAIAAAGRICHDYAERVRQWSAAT